MYVNMAARVCRPPNLSFSNWGVLGSPRRGLIWLLSEKYVRKGNSHRPRQNEKEDVPLNRSDTEYDMSVIVRKALRRHASHRAGMCAARGRKLL